MKNCLLIIPLILCLLLTSIYASPTMTKQASYDQLIKQIDIEIEALKAKQTHSVTKKRFVIVIDPGHGGKDTGALGRDGVKEKNIALAIAKQLTVRLNKNPSIKAILTRRGDYFVSLMNRLKFARRHKADLFIAIHADAHFDRRAEGVSVYALSEKGATSVAARWLAERENHSELGAIDLNDLPDNSAMVRSVLIDMAQTRTTQDSIRLGRHILTVLDTISTLHYAEVEQAPFLVLKSPDIPSILIETGFISNPREERRLQSVAYQDRVAAAIEQGVQVYLKKNPSLAKN